MEPGSTCWLSPSVHVRVSEIEGTGLFAARPIAAGELVSRLGGRLVSTEQLHRLFEESREYVDTITVADDQHLVLPLGAPNHHGNHSCDPNLWWSGPFDLIARRDIRAGEEVTNDYAASTTDPDFSLQCRCGSAGCRGIVRSSDAWVHRLDEVYEGHVVPAVAAGIARRPDRPHAGRRSPTQRLTPAGDEPERSWRP